MFRVFLVDDEPVALNGLATLIAKLDPRFEIVGMYADPAQALDEADAMRPDVVFTDISMPGMSGIDLIRRMRQHNMDAEAIIISAHRSFEMAKDGFELEVRQYLLKPFDKYEIKNVLEKIAGRLTARRGAAEESRASALKEAGAYSFCCVAASTQALELPGQEAKFLLTRYPMDGAPKAYLLSFENRPYQSALRKAIRKGRCGISTIRADFTDIAAMEKESLMSLHGGFAFSAHEQIAQIQCYLYDLQAQKVDVKGLAAHFHLSPGYLSSLFKKEVGTNIVSFYHDVHMYRAANRLRTSSASLVRIAEELGYSDYNYFARVFKRAYGVSPEIYRKAETAISKETDV